MLMWRERYEGKPRYPLPFDWNTGTSTKINFLWPLSENNICQDLQNSRLFDVFIVGAKSPSAESFMQIPELEIFAWT